MDETNFSDLINKPSATLAGLTAARTSAVRLRRRGDDADLMLTTADRYEREQAIVATAAVLLAELLRDLDAFTDVQLRRVMKATFPWSTFLDADDLREFAAELADTIRAATDLENLAPVTTVIAAWRNSAEVHADPELLRVLTQPAGDYGVIAAPGTAS